MARALQVLLLALCNVESLAVVARQDARKAFLGLNLHAINQTETVKFDRVKQIVQPCDEACKKAGAWGTDSSCRTQCETEMYMCHDNNHTVATEEFQACSDKVVAKYETYQGPTTKFFRQVTSAKASKQIVKPCEDACFKAGEAGDESSCFTMCESEMYKCHDHNHTVATEEFQACHDEVVAKYEKYHAELIQKRQIVKPCADACVKAGEAGEESSCYTMCESEMYKCHDHNHTVAVAEFTACHDEVVAKYEKYHAELIQKRQIVKPCADACVKAGEAGDESSCYTMCESEMYKCHDHNHTVAVAEFQACHDEVVAKYEKYHAELLLASTKQIVKPCADACFKAGEAGEESSCYTMCESEMYKCHDHNHTVAVAEFTACHDEVVAKYEKYHAELLQNSTHMRVASFDKAKQIVKPCEDACFKAGEAGDESSCFTMCESEMYKCHDHNHTVAVDEFQACHDEVVAKYEKYHAELIQRNRTLSAGAAKKVNKTEQIVKPCEEACFKADKDSNQQCQTDCEVAMYKCHDYNHTVANSDFRACHDEVMAKYEQYGK